jgi:sugar lactone lactonase YvrE
LRPNAGNVSTLAVKADYLMDLTVDDAGNLYLAELDAIRRVAPDGTVTVLASVASGANSAQVDADKVITEPRGIARDRQGTLYITSYRRIYKLFPDGRVEAMTGLDPDLGDSIAVDSHGNIFVANERRDTISKLAPDGTVTPFAGRWIKDAPSGLVGSGYQDGPGAQALFRMPSDLAIDTQDNLYVADSNNSAIRKIDPAGNVTTVVGQGRDVPMPPSPSPGQPSPDLAPFLSGRFSVHSVAIDAAGTLYAAGRDNRIRTVSPRGEVTLLAGDGTVCPDNIGFGGGGMIADPAASPTPVPSPVTCFQDGPGSTSRFKWPRANSVDGAGRVYLADGTTFMAMRVRKIV